MAVVRLQMRLGEHSGESDLDRRKTAVGLKLDFAINAVVIGKTLGFCVASICRGAIAKKELMVV